MSKSFNTLTDAISRMYGQEASKFESLCRVFNGLVDPLNTVDQLGVATEIIKQAKAELKEGTETQIERLHESVDELLEAVTELDTAIEETARTRMTAARRTPSALADGKCGDAV